MCRQAHCEFIQMEWAQLARIVERMLMLVCLTLTGLFVIMMLIAMGPGENEAINDGVTRIGKG